MEVRDLTAKDLEELLYPQQYLVVEEEDKVGDPAAQEILVDYLKDVLRQLYVLENWAVAGNRDLHHPSIQNQPRTITPDITVFKNIELTPEERFQMRSYFIAPPERPCPPVVFEIASASTLPKDVGINPLDKPATYGRIGVREYFTYDPNEPQVWTNANGVRLRGWRYTAGQAMVIQPDERGRLWSEELQSWLVPAGRMLRLQDSEGRQRPTAQQAENRAKCEAEAIAQQEARRADREEKARIEAQAKADREEKARQEAEAKAEQEAQARQEVEAKAKAETEARQKLEKELAELKAKFGLTDENK
jgi:Uma2 family endonuclease